MTSENSPAAAVKPLATGSRHYAVWLVLLAGSAVFGLTMGTRQSMGLFLSSLNTSTGLGLANISLAFAFGQIFWGLTQPFAGAYADKYGAGRVLLIGIALVALGTFITPMMTTTTGLIFAIGVLAAGGAGIAGPAVLMGATARMIPLEKQGIAIGVVNAGGSFGQFLMAPIAGALLVSIGWANAMQTLALFVILALPAAFVFRGQSQTAKGPATPVQKPLSARDAIRGALGNPSYLLLGGGFFVCGFHVAFLGTHLPGVVAACGLPTQWGAWSLATLGLFNIMGSLLMGWAMGHWRMKSLLSLVYAARAVAVILFLLAPKTGPVMLAFAAVMGLTFLSTVPPTAGLVSKFFGTANLATLFGIVMLTHQAGGFLGAYLGGKIFDATGSFDWVWYIDIVLAIGAALIHLPIKEALLVPKPPMAQAA
jgi:MFS family permease